MALDAFPRTNEINESNFLRLQPSRLIDQSQHQSLKDALDVLGTLKKPLQLLNSEGRLGEITNWQQYMEALRWLNGEVALSQWVGIPQIDNYRSADQTQADSFSSFVGHLRNNLVNQAVFQQSQMYIAAVETKIIDDITKEKVDKLQGDFDKTLADSRSNLITSLEELQSQKEESLNKSFDTQLQDIRLAGDKEVAKFEQARALANWSEFYAERVRFYEIATTGRHWPINAIKRKWQSYTNYRKNFETPSFWSWRVRTSVGQAFFVGLGRCFLKSLEIFRSKIFSFSGKRFFWFTTLLVGVGAIVVVNVASIYDVRSLFDIDPTKLRPVHNDTQLFAKIAVYVAFFVVPALGYSFANKNYRIYNNILEQYRHREIVARTIQGILKQPTDGSDADIRKELTNVAANALFEQKTIGHLSKNEANSPSILDVIKIFKG